MSVISAYILPHPPIILPEVGKGEEEKLAATDAAYKEAARRIAHDRPETIVLISPHAISYSNYFHISPQDTFDGDMGSFGAYGVSVSVGNDLEFVGALEAIAAENGTPAGTRGGRRKSMDHGAVIPLTYIMREYTSFKLVRVSLSGCSQIDHYKFGKCIEKAAENLGRRVVVIASADLSHRLMPDGSYGFAPEGPRFDVEMTRAMARGDFMSFLSFDPDFIEEAGECGLRSCIIMSGALDGRAVKSELLSYEGPFGVGYAVCCIEPLGEDASRRFDISWEKRAQELAENALDHEDDYVRVARLSLETYLKTGSRPVLPSELPEEMLSERAGAFVCIKRNGLLRGCMGTTGPTTKNIATEILRMAIAAGTQDYRFPAVTKAELPELTYTVDIMGVPEITTAQCLNPKKYGIIVSSGNRRGLLLPDLDGIETPSEQIKIALDKAGILETEPYTIERFEVVRHG